MDVAARPRSVKPYLPDAAIVNLYREGDTLGGHLDDVEADMDQVWEKYQADMNRVWGQEYEVQGPQSARRTHSACIF